MFENKVTEGIEGYFVETETSIWYLSAWECVDFGFEGLMEGMSDEEFEMGGWRKVEEVG